MKLSDIEEHLRGITVNGQEAVIGVYPLHANGTCRFLVYDFDNHEKDAEGSDFANTDTKWMEEVKAMREICLANGIAPLVERSRSGRGAHVWILFKEFVDAALARKFGYGILIFSFPGDEREVNPVCEEAKTAPLSEETNPVSEEVPTISEESPAKSKEMKTAPVNEETKMQKLDSSKPWKVFAFYEQPAVQKVEGHYVIDHLARI
ncbi:MAG: hypothetical protein LUF35_00835 [Lachnospiraceae bacterium]|nr:hypothetical protein [Lachnospiraceae bacterium]